jgi:acyl transferase domain-containing protein
LSVALVGIGCRFPGGIRDAASFWNVVAGGKDVVSELTPERWHAETWYHPDPSVPGRVYSRAAGCLEQDIALFDAEFFGISGREASRIDPQHRLLLEVTWEALEDAGLAPSRLAGSASGVFIGICTTEYGELQHRDSASISSYTNVGSSCSLAANRISYALDLHGPSIAVDTACSSSLVALHLACQSLREGQCETAVVGGVNLLLLPTATVGFSKASMLSPTGRCRAFDVRADGYVRSEGAGVVVLKPLAAALTAGDRIYAVIRGTGVNQDGRTSGISLPNEWAQQELIRRVLAVTATAPHTVQYVEAHGTGTPAGDPIECRALGAVLGQGRSEDAPCRLGSVKTNIGHTEGASGMAGLIKLALALHHRQLPPSLHCETPSPHIDFRQLRLAVQRSLEAWPENSSAPRTAVINSFGFGGTNAHALLQGSPLAPALPSPPPDHPDRAELLVLSGRSTSALVAQAKRYVAYLEKHGQIPSKDVCAAAALHRQHLEYRLAMVGRSSAELRDQLRALSEDIAQTGDRRPARDKLRVVFVYAGNGPQWWGMARKLLDEEPVFRQAVERCDLALRPYADWSLMLELANDEHTSRMDRTDIAQPALFAVQYGLTELWKAWGVEPVGVLGHSVGEVMAALAAGALSFDDAIQIIFHRSRTQERTAGRGKMAAVGLSQDEAEQAVASYPGRLAVAAVNPPQSVTLSGDEEAMTELGGVLTQRQVFFRVLALNYPFHCRHMDPIADELQQSLQSLTPRAASIPFVSSVTGTELGGEHLGPEYWWKNIRLPVLFAQAIRALAARGVDVWLEIGPHPVLASYITETLANEGSSKVLPSLRRLQDDRTMLLGTLGTLHSMGLDVCWQRLFPGPTPHLDLPRYSWQYERFWNETTSSIGKMRGIAVHPLLGGRLEVARPTWENELDGRLQPYLLDHQLQGAVVFPAAGYVELGLAVAQELLGDVACALEDLDIRKALTLAKGPTVLQTASTLNEHTFEVFSRPTDDQLWVSHATFQLQRIPTAPPSSVDLQALRQRVHRPKCRATHYRDTARCGLQYGPTFQGIRDLWAGGNEALGEIQLPADLGHYRCHPALLDACFQVLFAALPSPGQENRPAFLPVRIERFRFHGGCPSRVYCHVRIRKQSPHLLLADGVVCDTSGRVVAEIVGFHLHPVELHGRVGDEGLYAFRWEAASWQSTALPAPQQLDEQVLGQMELLFEQRGRKHFYNSFRPLVETLRRIRVADAWRAGGDLTGGDTLFPKRLAGTSPACAALPGLLRPPAGNAPPRRCRS